MTSPTGYCCCIFGGNKGVVIVLFAGGISTAIFFLRRNLGHGDSVLCDTAVKWMAPCYIFAFIHIINACIPEAKFGP